MAMTDKEILKAIIARLETLKTKRRWMTAKGLAANGTANPSGASAGQIERLLVRHAESDDSKVRYAQYPSRKSLDILWGHVANVGKRSTLPELLKIGELDVEGRIDLATEERDTIFLSHSHRDFDRVLALRDALADDFGVWIFEAQIAPGERIIDEVRDSLRQTSAGLVYITINSIDSLWVSKETDTALRSGDVYFAADATEDWFFELLRKTIQDGHPPYREAETLLVEKTNGTVNWNRARALLQTISEQDLSLHDVIEFPASGKDRGMLSLSDFRGRQLAR